MAVRVLLIDDDVRLFELLASYLEQNGFHGHVRAGWDARGSQRSKRARSTPCCST